MWIIESSLVNSQPVQAYSVTPVIWFQAERDAKETIACDETPVSSTWIEE